tara:strand:- start:283 stop:474 length:192 start_codon:yes stop_codon:yes gene_type:complete
MQPRQSGRHIFLLVFYPLLITKGAIFKHFIDDLKQFPQICLVLVAVLAYLLTCLQILQRIMKI